MESKFDTRWYQHVNQLSRLKANLPSEHQEEVDEHITALEDLVDEAHEHYESEHSMQS